MSKYFKVLNILDARSIDGRNEFKVKWKGYGPVAESWVTEEDCNSAIKNYARSLEAKEKAINYLVYEIGRKLCLRTVPTNRIVRWVRVKVPMDSDVFEHLFSSVSRQRTRFDVTAEDLDNLLPPGWSERAFKTSTKCVVSRDRPITVRFMNKRKVHFDHSECPRCQWSGNGKKPCLCRPKKTWTVEVGYLFLTFSRQRTKQVQAKEERIHLSWAKSRLKNEEE